MIYEYLFPQIEKLKDKPLRSDEIMKTLNQAELFPLHLRVDNHTGQVFVYFDEELNKKGKSRLDATINEFFKRWLE
jgi:hypothetical protein